MKNLTILYFQLAAETDDDTRGIMHLNSFNGILENNKYRIILLKRYIIILQHHDNR